MILSTGYVSLFQTQVCLCQKTEIYNASFPYSLRTGTKVGHLYVHTMLFTIINFHTSQLVITQCVKEYSIV